MASGNLPPPRFNPTKRTSEFPKTLPEAFSEGFLHGSPTLNHRGRPELSVRNLPRSDRQANDRSCTKRYGSTGHTCRYSQQPVARRENHTSISVIRTSSGLMICDFVKLHIQDDNASEAAPRYQGSPNNHSLKSCDSSRLSTSYFCFDAVHLKGGQLPKIKGGSVFIQVRQAYPNAFVQAVGVPFLLQGTTYPTFISYASVSIPRR